MRCAGAGEGPAWVQPWAGCEAPLGGQCKGSGLGRAAVPGALIAAAVVPVGGTGGGTPMSPLGHRNPGASPCSSLPEECLAQPQWPTHRMDQWLGQRPGTQASCPPEAAPGQETPVSTCSGDTG